MNEKEGKRVSRQLNYEYKDYKVTYAKIDRYSDINTVELLCHVDGSSFDDLGAINRRLNRMWTLNTSGTPIEGFIVAEMLDSVIYNGKGSLVLISQFRYDTGHCVDDDIFDVVRDIMINTIKDSGLGVYYRKNGK